MTVSMKNQLKTIVLIGALSALVLGIGSAVAPGHLYLFIALSLAMNLGAYFFSDKIVLRMHRAQELGPEQAPELYAMVGELAERAQIPRPRLYSIPDPQPNAFATGRNPEHGVVAVTEGIVHLLSPRELRGVLAHEIAHIKNRDILVSSIAAVMASVVTNLVNAVAMMSLFGGNRSDEEGESGGGSSFLLMLVAPIAATLVQLGISRSREYLADETGAKISGDPEALASALLKLERGAEAVPSMDPQPATASLFIVNPLAGGGSVMRLFATHPATEERVRRLHELSRTIVRVDAGRLSTAGAR
jgi:heat shock protein HtpX